MRDIDSLARQPVQADLGVGTDYEVPAGKRLVIEYVSGFVTVDDFLRAVGIRTTVGVSLFHALPVVRTEAAALVETWSFGDPVRLYADGGSKVRLSLISGAAPLVFTGSISGYLEDAL